MRIIHTSNQWSVVSGQWPVVSGQQAVLSAQYSVLSTSLLMRNRRQRSLSPLLSPLSPASRGFTMMELLVVVVIIGILAGMVLGALQMARQAAREAATKATIAKLNNIIMQRYESYMTRRVPIPMTDSSNKPFSPLAAAGIRLVALRQLMRMEMPERWSDIVNPCDSADNKKPNLVGTTTIVYKAKNGTIYSAGTPLSRPALSKAYAQLYIAKKYNTAEISPDYSSAECLYMAVSIGSPEAMEQFNQSEIGDVDGDGLPEFVDGWKRPIQWLRCAPAYSGNYSNIQVANANTNHDPFDPRHADTGAYHLIPLIYSAGSDGKYGLDIEKYYQFVGDPFGTFGFACSSGGAAAPMAIGSPTADDGSLTDFYDNITNHNIEMR